MARNEAVGDVDTPMSKEPRRARRQRFRALPPCLWHNFFSLRIILIRDVPVPHQSLLDVNQRLASEGPISNLSRLSLMNNNTITTFCHSRMIPETDDPLKEITDAMPLLIWVADRTGKVIHYNRKVRDYTGSIIDKKGNWIWENLIHPDDLESSLATWNECILSRKTYEMEHRLKMADRSYQWHLSRATPKIGVDGNSVRWYGTATNIHAQKKYESKSNGVVATPSEELRQRTKPVTEAIKSLPATQQQTALNRYNKRFLTEFSQKFSSYDGRDEFFHSLVKFLYDMTGLDYVLVGKADTDSEGKFVINTIALTAFGEVANNITYPMSKGPCYEVIKGQLYSYPKNCRRIFPENRTLVEFEVEGYLGYPLYDGNGNATGLIAVMHQKEIADDETVASILRIVAKRAEFELDRIEYEKALKKHNKELQISTNRLQSTLNGVPAMITLLEVVYDQDKQPVDFVISAGNKATGDFAGCEMNQLIGKRMTALYPEGFRPKLMDSYLQVFSTGDPLCLEFFNPELKKWYSVFVTNQVDGNGVVSFVLEITEQKKAEEERKKNLLLAELDQAKTEFFSNVSHEFRTPLTLILGPLSDVITNLHTSSTMPEDLEKLRFAERNALRLQKLVNTLLEFSRIEAGRSDAVFQPTDIAEFTTLLASNFRSVMEKAGLRFVISCQSVEPIYVNLDMWEQIVLNLISNAFKFTFEGKIEVMIKDYKKHIQLCVNDSGIGISKQNVSKIFERFARIRNSKSRTYEGSGIGLALVKELVNMHGGSIKVKSEEGEGTAIMVSIPKGRNHLPARNIYELKETRTSSSLSAVFENEAVSWLPDTYQKVKFRDGSVSSADYDHAKNPKVLLVDDNSDLREYIKRILGEKYTSITANNGRSALELIRAGMRPDLILADVMMPEMDGYALLCELRKSMPVPRIPFIILTANASEEARIEGMRYDVDDYLVKPFSSRELLARIDSRLKIAAIQNSKAHEAARP